MKKNSDQAKGIAITVCAVLIISPDTLIVRLLNLDHWTLLFWRGTLVASGILISLCLFYRSNTLRQFRNIGSAGLTLILLFTASTLSFVIALSYTSVANTLVIIATAPIFAAVLSRFILGESINIFTAFTILAVLSAIVLIVSDSYRMGTLFGDVCAMGTAVCIAASFVTTRRSKHINMIPAIALSSMLTAAIALLVADSILIDADQFKLLLILGSILTLGMGLLIIGPRYISAPQVSLMMPLETVFGTFLVWTVIGEPLSYTTVIGGAVIIISLTFHSYYMIQNA